MFDLITYAKAAEEIFDHVTLRLREVEFKFLSELRDQLLEHAPQLSPEHTYVGYNRDDVSQHCLYLVSSSGQVLCCCTFLGPAILIKDLRAPPLWSFEGPLSSLREGRSVLFTGSWDLVVSLLLSYLCGFSVPSLLLERPPTPMQQLYAKLVQLSYAKVDTYQKLREVTKASVSKGLRDQGYDFSTRAIPGVGFLPEVRLRLPDLKLALHISFPKGGGVMLTCFPDGGGHREDPLLLDLGFIRGPVHDPTGGRAHTFLYLGSWSLFKEALYAFICSFRAGMDRGLP